MKKLLLRHFSLSRKGILTLLFATFALTSFGQFQQRVTINGSIGAVVPTGEYEYYDDYDGEYYPYIFSNFYSGASFSGGLQYNFNQRFSIEGKLYTFYLWDWYYEDYHDLTLDFWHLSLGAVPKLYLRPGKKLNPFGFAEINLSFNDIGVEDSDYGDYEEIISGQMAFGTFLGAGTDLNILSNLGLYVQGGYYLTFLGTALEVNIDQYENFKAIRLEAGVKISLFKSKQL